MRVVFVGGAGAMGAKAVSTASAFGEFTELVIADRDLGAAERLAADLGPRVSAVRFDADTDSAEDLFAGAWGVLNTLGPFTRFGAKVMTAAIASGCHYVDINDDWEPTLEALELHEAAHAAGVTALIGMGASPGISNVLAARAAVELDEMHELVTGWALAGTTSESVGNRPSAAMLHFVHQSTGTIQVVEEGVEAQVKPLQEMTIQYPGIGPVTVRTIGHPEAVTLPRHFPGLTRCVNVMAGPSWYFDTVAQLMSDVERGSIAAEEAALQMDQTPVRPPDAPPTVRTPTIWAWASGVRNGIGTIVAAGLNRWPEGKMAGATGIPAAIALRLLARGDITHRGVVTPEQAVPFEQLIAELEPLYTEPSGSLLPLVTVTSEELALK